MEALRLKLKWLMGIRVAFVSLTLGVWIYLQLDGETPGIPAYSLIIATYLLTIVYSFLINRIQSATGLQVFAYAQIGIDMLCDIVTRVHYGWRGKPVLAPVCHLHHGRQCLIVTPRRARRRFCGGDPVRWAC